MNRLRATNSVAFASRDVAPATGTPQYATDGNPATNTPPTIWPSYAYNMLQDEVIAVLARAGITPDDTNWAQLVQGINRIAGGNITTYAASAVLTVDQAGIVLVSATSGAVALTLPAAAGAGGVPFGLRIYRTDASANSVTLTLHAGDSFLLGGATATVPANGYLRLWSDGVSHWVVEPSRGAMQFTTSGTFTVPVGVGLCFVSGIAGGGGGGGGYGDGSNANAGGGGASGQMAYRVPLVVTPGQSIAVTIPAASTGGAGSTTTGVAAATGAVGGAVSFGALLSLVGGTPGSGAQQAFPGSGGSSVGGGSRSGGTGGGVASAPAVTAVGGVGGASAFGNYGAGGDGGRSNATPVVGAGNAGGPGFLQVEW